MRLVLGVISLLVALAVVGVLVKKRMGVTAASQNTALACEAAAATCTKNLQLQGQRIQQQIKLSAEASMQRPQVADTQ